MTPMKVFLETFGCQMNILDSELVEGQLLQAGHNLVSDPKDANVVLLNTCSVRNLSEHKVLSRLGILKDRKSKGEKIVVGVLGCMAERAHDDLLKNKSVIDVMIGPSKIHETKELVEKVFYSHKIIEPQKSLSYFVNRKGKSETALMSPLDSLEALDRLRPLNKEKNNFQAYVRITRGCNKFCSFCVVPRTRGPEMHRPLQSIIDEVKKLVDNGAMEVTLLGQTINHYFFEENNKRYSFADLLFRVHEEVKHLPRLRFLTSYPKDFSDEALDVMRDCERICKYLHVPAQSGSNKVLKEMNRGYDIETYLSFIERAKSRMPDINIIGDMIVGFPNESEDDFNQSLDLLRKVQYKNVFVFKYSPRPNTIANKNLPDNIAWETKKLRNNQMLEVQNEISLRMNKDMIGKEFKVLCDSLAKIDKAPEGLVSLRNKSNLTTLTARSEGDHIIHFNGPKELIGKIVRVKITQARQLSLSGELLD